MEHDRHGARQPHRFDPARAKLLDERERFETLPPQDVFALLELTPEATVVDFGTGTGTYALELARSRPDVRVVALDEQAAMLEHLWAKLKETPLKNVEPILAPSAASEALRGRADRVLALNVLHELGDEALGQLKGLLAPTGLAVFVDWNALVDRPVGPPRDHVYSPAEARAKLQARGLQIVRERNFLWHYAFVCRPQ